MEVKKINGELFRSLIINGCENLKLNYQYIDSLNVFPVPDGDTGTNMCMTISSAAREVTKSKSKKIPNLDLRISTKITPTI